MRKFPFVKRTIVSVLCVALLLTGNLSTMATEIGEMVTEATETTETMKGETVVATETESETESESEIETETETATETELEIETESEIETETESEQEEVKTVNYTYENDDAIITVSAEEGMLPAEAELSVAPITSGDEYQEVKSQLENDAEENDYEIAGFLAYDICFLVDGEEVEPEGAVNVVIDYKEAAIPESVQNAEKTSVSIMHFEESDSQIEVKNISADSNVSVTSNNEVEKVEFTTETFSRFVIAWKNGIQVTVYYVDAETGQEISGTQSQEVQISENETISFLEYAGKINGYQYQNARLDNLWTGDEVTSVKATKETEYFLWWQTSTNYYLTFYNESTVVKEDVNYSCTVYLTYKDVSDQIETLDTSKNITINLFDYKANTADSSDENVGMVKTNATDDSGINHDHYLKFMNSCTNNDTKANSYAGSTERKNIVANELDKEGYPVLSGNTEVWGAYADAVTTESLKYLFDADSIDNAKKAYCGANYLFQYDDEGYYVYDSAENFATIAGNTENIFTVYDSAYAGFFPFTTKDNAKNLGCNNRDKGDTLGSEYVNHYFGMTIETDFVQPKDGQINGKDMIFEFSGDDDVWVFIDGKLALDLGGIHDAVGGSINFATGEVKTESGAVTKLSSLGISMENYSVHTMKFFYLERGNQQSNCKIKFNLQTIPKGSLTVLKNVEGLDDENAEYQFTVADSDNNVLKAQAYTIFTDGVESGAGTTDATTGYFSLKDNQYVVFQDLVAGTYKVEEVGVLGGYALEDFVTTAKVNGEDSESADRTYTVMVSDSASTMLVVKNEYANKTKKIKVTKEWEDDNNIYNTRPTSLNLNIYGQITTTEGIRYVVANQNGDDSLSEEKVSYDNFVLTKDDVVETNTNQWCKSWEVPVYYNDNGTKKVISWSIEEGEYSGSAYKYESKEGVQEVNITTASIELTSYLSNISNPQWDHVDVKTQAAFSANASSQTVEALRSADGTNNVVTITGYMPKNSNTWNSGTKNSRTLTKHSSSAEWSYSSNGSNCFDGVSYINYNTKVSFQVKLSGEENYRTIELTGTDVYPQGTYLLKSVGYASKIQRYYGLSETTVKDGTGNDVKCYDISGLNIYTVSALSCDGVSYSSSTTGQSFNVDGLDFVLSIETIKDNDINNLKVTKVWNDNGNVNQLRPSSVSATVQYSDDSTETIVLSEANGWTWSNSIAKTIKAVTEQDVPNYTASIVIAEDGKSATITNTCTSDSDPTKDQEFYVKNTLVSRTLVLNKVWNDADQMYGQMRSAVTFTVQSSTDAGVTWTDYEDVVITADDNWTKTLIVPSGCTYRVIEKNVDSRYSSNATVEAPASEVVGDDNTASITVTNTLNLTWNIIKKSASEDSDIVLEGAEFTLTSEDETYTGVSDSSGKVIWSKGDLNNVTPVSGTYTLKETVAPAGYSVSTDVWTIEITDGVLTSVKVNDNNIDLTSDENFNKDDLTVTLVFEDEALYSLPATGGAGIFAYMFGGMFLMMAGALYIFVCRRKAYRA